ncbi:MAG TPA: hypothetical protein VN871_04175, partial [Mycobacterium sp.]|nr:hypothetical protein [Mycobacterium sp.]
MNRRIHAAGVAATAGGGILAAAFLQASDAVATADDAGFTVGGLSFEDPVALPGLLGGVETPGYESIFPTFFNAPLLSIGSDDALGILQTGSQQFTVEDSTGTTLGTVDTQINDQNLLGLNTAQFTVVSSDPASGLSDSQAAALPTDGTVYSITNLGSGFANVYEAIPNADGTAASSITDTLVTPFGDVNVPTTYDAIAPLNPATPLEALGDTSGAAGASDNAFTIGSTTFDPGADGFSTPLVPNVFSVAPLLNFGAGSLDISGSGNPEATQNFEVFTGGADAGQVQTSLMYSDLLGLNSTQFTVEGITPNGDATDLPAVGTVYSVTDLGSGYENIYEAIPNADNTAAASITDTLVTPFGNIDLSTPYDAIAFLDPATPLADLAATSSNAAVSDNAFAIGGTIFDPGAAGFTTIGPLFGIAPVLEIAGGQLAEPDSTFSFATQAVEAYDSSGTDLGSLTFGENMSNILGFINTTQFGVASEVAASGLTPSQAAELPAVGTVYSVTDFGSGFENIYEAIPNADDTAASSIIDTLVTPFGNIDVPSMFDAIAPLDPGAAAAGVDAASSAAAA